MLCSWGAGHAAGSNSSFARILSFQGCVEAHPAGAASCPPSCSGKQPMFLGETLPGERVGQENSLVPGKGEVRD